MKYSTVGSWRTRRNYFQHKESSLEKFMQEETIPAGDITYEELENSYGAAGDYDLTKTIKESNPMFYPYEYKVDSKEVIASNIVNVQALVLDIDNDDKAAKCTIQTFLNQKYDFEFFLYTSVKHAIIGSRDRFRVVIPLKEADDPTNFKRRAENIFKFFSVNGESFIDSTCFESGRGFLVPIDLPRGKQHYNRSEHRLNIKRFEMGDPIESFVSVNPIKPISGMDDCEEVKEIINEYRGIIPGTMWKGVTRHNAYFKLLKEAASYGITTERLVEVGREMDRGMQERHGASTESGRTKQALRARKSVSTYKVQAVEKLREYTNEAKLIDKLSQEDIPIRKGMNHLLLSPTGTGKTTVMVGRDTPMQIIFAAPLNTIVEQQYMYSLERGDDAVKETGTSSVLPPNKLIFCSYNRLIAMIEGNSDMSNCLIVIDECHRLLTDTFRVEVMTSLVECINATKGLTTVFMSGTFNPADLGNVRFDHVFRFRKEGSSRQITIAEGSKGPTQNVLDVLKMCGENVLVLLDSKPRGTDLMNRLSNNRKVSLMYSGKSLSEDKQEREEMDNLLKMKKVQGIVITTQVLLEGIDLGGMDDIIIVGDAAKCWGVDQMVQFYGRDRDWASRCWFVRPAFKGEEMETALDAPKLYDMSSRKNYINEVYDHSFGAGFGMMKLAGAKNLGKMLRVVRGDIYLNTVYPYMEQKKQLDKINYYTNFKGKFKEHMYDVDPDVLVLSGDKDVELIEIEKLRRKEQKQGFEDAVVRAIQGVETEGYPAVWSDVNMLMDAQFKSAEETARIMLNKDIREGYHKRVSDPQGWLEHKIYAKFKEGTRYHSGELKEVIDGWVVGKELEFLVRDEKNYLKILKRYFEVKRSSSKYLLVKSIDVVDNLV